VYDLPRYAKLHTIVIYGKPETIASETSLRQNVDRTEFSL